MYDWTPRDKNYVLTLIHTGYFVVSDTQGGGPPGPLLNYNKIINFFNCISFVILQNDICTLFQHARTPISGVFRGSKSPISNTKSRTRPSTRSGIWLYCNQWIALPYLMCWLYVCSDINCLKSRNEFYFVNILFLEW